MSIPAHLVQRVIPTTPLARLALSSQALQQLGSIASDLRNGPFPPSVALFLAADRDSPGLAAEALAHSLGRSLIRLDVASLVESSPEQASETIDHVLATADPGTAILFFDEADALFGKRSSVQDSHDRYANIEIDYLLQRLQTVPGLSIIGACSVTNPIPGKLIRYTVNLPQPPHPSPQS